MVQPWSARMRDGAWFSLPAGAAPLATPAASAARCACCAHLHRCRRASGSRLQRPAAAPPPPPSQRRWAHRRCRRRHCARCCPPATRARRTTTAPCCAASRSRSAPPRAALPRSRLRAPRVAAPRRRRRPRPPPYLLPNGSTSASQCWSSPLGSQQCRQPIPRRNLARTPCRAASTLRTRRRRDIEIEMFTPVRTRRRRTATLGELWHNAIRRCRA
jgi:hypothetical protein